MSCLHAHDALCLLRHAFSLPKVLYLLRTAPCYLSSLLADFDVAQKELLESICNIHLSDQAWLQANLPVASGGLGIRCLVSLAPLAFLASVNGSSALCALILPERCLTSDYRQSSQALQVWKQSCPIDTPVPSGSAARIQKSWDQPIVEAQYSSLLSGASPKNKARLLVAGRKESGAWLNAPPVTALGLRMENIVITTAVGLRLGLLLCSLHTCHLCGKDVDESGTHGLSCWRSLGRHPRHSFLNDLIKRSLGAINIPSLLEPRGLCKSDDSRPDGLTLIPWSRGRCLVWDVTVHNTFAASYISLACRGAGLVANQAAYRKIATYGELAESHIFLPLAMETTGVFSDHTLSFLSDLYRRTAEPDAMAKICQCISVCIQCCNSAAIFGSFPPVDYTDDELYLY